MTSSVRRAKAVEAALGKTDASTAPRKRAMFHLLKVAVP